MTFEPLACLLGLSRREQQPDTYFDPIEVERRIRERDAFVANLFHPVYWEGPAWEMKWLVQDLIPTGYLVMLAGPPKCGKTCLATALALSVANGLPFAGRPTSLGGVLWISAEESPRERHLLLNGSPLVEPSTPLYTCYHRLSVVEDRTLEAIADWVTQTDAKLLVIDPFLACAGHSLTDSWMARRSLQELKVFAEMRQITIIVLHHQKRDLRTYRRGRVADNDQLAATASMNIVLRSSPLSESFSEEPVGESRLVMLDCYGRGGFANRPIYLVSHGPLDYHPTRVEPCAPMAEDLYLADSEKAVLEVLQQGPRGSKAILAQTRRNEGTVRNGITSLRKKGLVKVITIGKNRRIYALTDSKAEPDLESQPCESVLPEAA